MLTRLRGCWDRLTCWIKERLTCWIFTFANTNLCIHIISAYLANAQAYRIDYKERFAFYLTHKRGYDTVDGRCTFRVVLPILEGRQLRIHCSDSELFFPTKQISVTRINTAEIAQIEIKWDLITKIQ